MIRVCDAIMGTGKSSAAITYMNEHPNDKFIYITPYLEEAKRIKRSCPDLQFVEPSNKIAQYNFNKNSHTCDLIKSDCNIATTHQAFKNYNSEMLDMIRDKGYTLIVDENVASMDTVEFCRWDLAIIEQCEYVRHEGTRYVLTGKQYPYGVFSDFFRLMGSRSLEVFDHDDGGGKTTMYFWMLPAELISSFKDVFILTYMFKGQGLYHMLKMDGMTYEEIGVERDSTGTFRFSEKNRYVPEYVSRLGDLIEVVDGKRINMVGDDKFALSKGWFDREKEGIGQLKKNTYNFFNKIAIGSAPSTRLWGTFKSAQQKLRGKGYTSNFLVFNARSTNAYHKCSYLAYLINVFMSVDEKNFYKAKGIAVDEDAYALSTMLQWIWRSAIREGNKILLYLPSKRMRDLLSAWIETTVKGGG